MHFRCDSDVGPSRAGGRTHDVVVLRNLPWIFHFLRGHGWNVSGLLCRRAQEVTLHLGADRTSFRGIWHGFFIQLQRDESDELAMLRLGACLVRLDEPLRPGLVAKCLFVRLSQLCFAERYLELLELRQSHLLDFLELFLLVLLLHPLDVRVQLLAQGGHDRLACKEMASEFEIALMADTEAH